MKIDYKIFGIVSVLLLIVLAVSPLKDYNREWRSWQKDFNKMIEEYPEQIEAIDIGIKQVWVEELDRVDRCISCHVAMDEELLENAEQPFSPHPKMYHDVFEFGCTICHRGQGAATTNDESKGRMEYWDDPMLNGNHIEATCGVCHKTAEVPEAPVLTHGRQLTIDYNCSACHNFYSYSTVKVTTLDGIGDKTSRKWLTHWFNTPKQFQPKTKMPAFNLTDEEISTLSDFLMGFRTYPGNAVLDELPPELADKSGIDDALVAYGEKIFTEAQCVSCHLLNDTGGPLARDIGKIASKARAQWIYNYVKDPRVFQYDVEMPQYNFSEEQLTAITAYLLTEFIDQDDPEGEATETFPADPDSYDKGLALFNEHNCKGCHNLTAEGVSKNMAPDLMHIGKKKVYEIDFYQSDIEKTLQSYLYNKIKYPDQFLEKALMPDFGFSHENIDALTTALLSMNGESVPDKLMVMPENVTSYQPEGVFREIIERYNCLSCHVIHGNGFFLASDLSNQGSRVHEDWLRDFFEAPYQIRPILAERMPNFYMTDEELEMLLLYSSLVLVENEISNIPLVESETASIAEGESQFFDNYACQSCHQVGPIGGQVGPSLDKIGSRLTTAWIYHWLKDPHKYHPEVVKPNQGLSDDEAIAIAYYLSSLK
jgi:mono/diheme cytochrome c family protein